MKYRTIKLRSLMRTQKSKVVTELISTFKCEKSPELEHFLRNVARLHDSKDVSKTYLLLDRNDSVAGFFTLALKCLTVSEELDEKICSSMNVDNGVAQAYLIGQLARSDDSEKGLGRMMIRDILETFSIIRESVGCRLVRLDCHDGMIPYYEEMGFRRIGYNEHKDLNQMAIFI